MGPLAVHVLGAAPHLGAVHHRSDASPYGSLRSTPRRAAAGPVPDLRAILHAMGLTQASRPTQPPMQPSSTTLPDADLVELARAGERAAFEQLIRRHDDHMRGLAYKLLGDRDRMDDALQEAYLRAFVSLPRFRGEAAVGTWLYRITYNACIDELRRMARHPVAGDAATEPASPRPGPERTVSAAETVRAALADLPPDQRVTVVLVDGEGFDHRDAARILGVKPGTVASRLHRARAHLRRILDDEAAP